MARRFVFEHKHEPILPHSQFLKRLLRSACVALGLLVATVSVGAFVYHSVEDQSWIDALLNAVMIMCGLGLVNVLTTFGGKLFTSVFAIFSAFVFYTTLAIFFTPILHRFLHHFHMDEKESK